MGIYNKGVLGPFSGKIGTTVGSNWRSVDYMRSLPTKKKSKTKVSKKRLQQNEKFTMAITFLSPWREFLDSLDRGNLKVGKTSFNKAMSSLMKMIQGEYPDLTIPYDKVTFAEGLLFNILPSYNESAPGKLTVEWPTINGFGASDNDKIVLLVYNTTTNESFIFEDALRGSGSHTLLIDDDLEEGIIHVWTLCVSADGKKYSSSIYCGPYDLKK